MAKPARRMIFVPTRSKRPRSKVGRGFTLIELLVIVAILATMVTIGVGTLSSGQGMARVKGATRDVYATIRHARSTALVTGQQVLVNYSNEKIDDEVVLKVEVVAAKIMQADSKGKPPQPYYVLDYKDLPNKPEKVQLVNIHEAADAQKPDGSSANTGDTIEEILFSPMSEQVVKGMRILVKKGDEALADESVEQMKSRISVFSNVDYLQSRYHEAKAEAAKKNAQEESVNSTGSVNDMDETVSVVWETNGAVEPHRIWIYPDGKKPEEGLQLNVDQFGGIKVVEGDEK